MTADIRSATLTDIAKAVTQLGALPSCAAVIVVSSIVLASRGQLMQVAVLVVGFTLIYVIVQVTKGAIDRPRPPAPLVETSGSSFPSGHAAYATAWVAAALTFTRRLGLASAAVAIGAVVLALAIGFSRIYLHVHLWSDVAGGWGLGIGVFGMLSALALIVDYIRHNGAERAQQTEVRAER
jgi:undecaprenyl-diphosphatase